MGLREKLIEYEENTGKKSTVTLTSDGASSAAMELVVDNCRCVISCDDNFVVLSVSGMDIQISGTPLTINNFGTGSIRITGKIHSLTFEEN